MSKEKNDNMEVASLEDGTEVIGTVKIEDEFANWDECHDTHNRIKQDIIELQMLIYTMVKENEAVIDGDKDLYASTVGLMKTVDDMSKELMETFARFNNKVGIISKADEEDNMLFIQICADHIATAEKFSALSSIAVTDILTQINICSGLVKDSIKVQNDIAEGISKNAEILDGAK